jgi:hypothetical protein
MEIVIGFVIVIFLWWLLILRPGKIDFWKLAKKFPDDAYDYFQSEECWMIFENELPEDYHTIAPKKSWTGPFQHKVPKLGGIVIKVFGRYPDFNQSQNRFVDKFRKKL